MFDVVTIGSITRDNFLEGDFVLEKWPKAPSGKALVLPFGEKLEITGVYSTIGGNSANAGVTFARQGFKTACFGKVGDDLSGKEIFGRLKKEGVKPLLAASKEKPTAYSVLLLKNAERTILGYHGASDTMQMKDIPWNSLKAGWWYLSLAGESDKFLKPLLNFAKKNNIKVAFNPSGYHIKHKRKEILDSLKDLAFLVLNRGEAEDLVGMSFSAGGGSTFGGKRKKEVFKKLDRMTPGIVAVTDGPNGVMVSDGKSLYKAGIFKEKKIVDRTGAGDAFGSGFVAGLMRFSDRSDKADKSDKSNKSDNFNGSGKPDSLNNIYSPEAIKYAIRLASANATSVVESIGATEGILTKKQFQSARWKNFKISVQKL